MEMIVGAIVAIISALLSSAGVWTFIAKRQDKKDSITKLIIGVAYDRIIFLGTHYINRGYITTSEYHNLYNNLVVPYEECNEDKTIEKIMEEVKKLEMRGD